MNRLFILMLFICSYGLLPCNRDVLAVDDGKARLDIEDFQLFNGEKGFELWRLRATFGNIIQNGDQVELETPKVRYALGKQEDNDFLYVVADKGIVKDKQRIVELWGNVVATRDREKLFADYVHYDSSTKQMTFPKGAVIKSHAGSMSARLMTWNLADDILIAEDNVVTDIFPKNQHVEEVE